MLVAIHCVLFFSWMSHADPSSLRAEGNHFISPWNGPKSSPYKAGQSTCQIKSLRQRREEGGGCEHPMGLTNPSGFRYFPKRRLFPSRGILGRAVNRWLSHLNPQVQCLSSGPDTHPKPRRGQTKAHPASSGVMGGSHEREPLRPVPESELST